MNGYLLWWRFHHFFLFPHIWSNCKEHYPVDAEEEKFFNSINSKLHDVCLRLVFTSDGVVVGVVIGSLEWYDLVKIKATESEAEHWFCLWLRRLRSSENCIVGVARRSGRINQWQCSIPGLAIGWFFHFRFRLRQASFHRIISNGVINRIRRNGNALILLIPIPSTLWPRLRLQFSIFTRS